jgi:hypothetical protein
MKTEQKWKVELTESQFQKQLTDFATLTGWKWVHFERAMNDRGYWRTPVSGPLGKGWPDLVLVHPQQKRLLFVELKTDKGPVSIAQQGVLADLGVAAEVYIWRPSQWEEIMGRLAG